MPGGAIDEILKEKSFNSASTKKDTFLSSDLIKKIISKYYSVFETIKNSDFKSYVSKRPIFTSSIAFIGLFIIGISLGTITQRKQFEVKKVNNTESADLVKPDNVETSANLLDENANKSNITTYYY